MAELDDKNKSDGLARYVSHVRRFRFLGAKYRARLITVVQVLMFSITCIARAIQHLAITTLELTTLAFVFSMIATSIMWKSKPQDIRTPLTLYTEVPIAEILKMVSGLTSPPHLLYIKAYSSFFRPGPQPSNPTAARRLTSYLVANGTSVSCGHTTHNCCATCTFAYSHDGSRFGP